MNKTAISNLIASAVFAYHGDKTTAILLAASSVLSYCGYQKTSITVTLTALTNVAAIADENARKTASFHQAIAAYEDLEAFLDNERSEPHKKKIKSLKRSLDNFNRDIAKGDEISKEGAKIKVLLLASGYSGELHSQNRGVINETIKMLDEDHENFSQKILECGDPIKKEEIISHLKDSLKVSTNVCKAAKDIIQLAKTLEAEKESPISTLSKLEDQLKTKIETVNNYLSSCSAEVVKAKNLEPTI